MNYFNNCLFICFGCVKTQIICLIGTKIANHFWGLYTYVYLSIIRPTDNWKHKANSPLQKQKEKSVQNFRTFTVLYLTAKETHIFNIHFIPEALIKVNPH